MTEPEVTKSEPTDEPVKSERVPWSTPRVIVSELHDSIKAGIAPTPESTGGVLS